MKRIKFAEQRYLKGGNRIISHSVRRCEVTRARKVRAASNLLVTCTCLVLSVLLSYGLTVVHQRKETEDLYVTHLADYNNMSGIDKVIGRQKNTSIVKMDSLIYSVMNEVQPLADFVEFNRAAIAYSHNLDLNVTLEATEQSKEETVKPYIITRYNQFSDFDIRTPSNLTVDDYYRALPKELHKIAEAVVQMENSGCANSQYLLAVKISETGWQDSLSGRHNYFNWSTDGIYYYDFESFEAFVEYSTRRYQNDYSNPEYYTTVCNGQTPSTLSIEVVNRMYARYEDGTVNTEWAKLVKEVMVILGDKLTSETRQII